ncbi:prepilin-type N-terminal cleavage/methylation domain-containing protein [Candidatus Saccharibacteria bacterium]|nr:prepilin-type N-terminal cleavage/methylation domain-containing protein [Candidatus Saccharibacteria bacterium]
MIHKKQPGFTIVELLIVIVVIGILAAITIVAYNGIQDRARVSAVSSGLKQTADKLAIYYVDNSSYPANLAAAGIVDSASAAYQYSFNNSVSPQTYCVTATNGSTSYKASSTATAPSSGGCAGHGVGGVGAVTNLAQNPKGVGSFSGWLYPLVPADITDTPNITWNGRTDWHRLTWTGTGNNTLRLRITLSNLVNGQSYYSSALVANNGAVSMSANFDFCDQNVTAFTVAPGETKRVGFAGSRATYDSTYSFLDMGMQPGAGILVTDVIITDGVTPRNYADGSSPNWVWNGTTNSSTSTGPPL